MTLLQYPLYGLLLLLSRLPLRVLYALSDSLLFPLLYWVLRYRRRLVGRQLAECLPELGEAERRRVERRFYRTLSDYAVETLRMWSMSPEEMRRRVEFVGVESLQEAMMQGGKLTNLTCLGHFGNWEWMSSVALLMRPDFAFAQVYHTLHSPLADRLLRQGRERWGGQCVSMHQTLRHILQVRAEGRHEIVGLIADQCPKWEAMHQWCEFLHKPTSFFIGAEAIGKRTGAVVTYLDVSRPKRGCYRAEVKLITDKPEQWADYEVTAEYARLLEASIRREPHLWLWTHDRWKRTRQEWEARQRLNTVEG